MTNNIKANHIPFLRKVVGSGMMLALFATGASAQRIIVKNDVIDCGNVMYDSPVTVSFEMNNQGGVLKIRDVKTACGCTTAEYPQAPIPDGGAFTVSATYDARQLGHFNKDIAIYSDALDKPVYLTMRGVVVDKVVGFTGNYNFTIADVKADKNDIEFDDVNRGDRPVQKINIMNTGTVALNPVVMHLPNYLKANVSPTTIAPGRQGVISIALDSKKLRDYGLARTSVYLGMYPGDKVSPEKEISVSAVLLPAFGEMTESQIAKAPQIRLSNENLDLGDFKGKTTKKGTIVIENVGHSDLEISSLQMFTDGLSVSLNKTLLKPNEQAKLKVKAEARTLKKARSKPRVLMITNDPLNPKVVININGEF